MIEFISFPLFSICFLHKTLDLMKKVARCVVKKKRLTYLSRHKSNFKSKSIFSIPKKSIFNPLIIQNGNLLKIICIRERALRRQTQRLIFFLLLFSYKNIHLHKSIITISRVTRDAI